MKKSLNYIVLMLSVMLIACNNVEEFKYPVYKEGEKKIAQLLLKDFPCNEAHILDYNGDLWSYKKEKRDMVEKIADFYDLDGYKINLYDSIRYSSIKLMKKNFEECVKENIMPYSNCIQPYEYKMNYINANGDTIGRLLWRYNDEGILYTPTILKEAQLDSIIKYLHVEDCRIYDHKINDLYSKKWEGDTQYIGCYAFSIGNTVILRDRTKDVLKIDDITLILKNDTQNYLRYYSDKELNLKQILKVLKEIGLPEKIVYFHKYYTELEYASSVYFESKKWYNIGMFSINKLFRAQFNETTLSWETKDISMY